MSWSFSSSVSSSSVSSSSSSSVSSSWSSSSSVSSSWSSSSSVSSSWSSLSSVSSSSSSVSLSWSSSSSVSLSWSFSSSVSWSWSSSSWNSPLLTLNSCFFLYWSSCLASNSFISNCPIFLSISIIPTSICCSRSSSTFLFLSPLDFTTSFFFWILPFFWSWAAILGSCLPTLCNFFIGLLFFAVFLPVFPSSVAFSLFEFFFWAVLSTLGNNCPLHTGPPGVFWNKLFLEDGLESPLDLAELCSSFRGKLGELSGKTLWPLLLEITSCLEGFEVFTTLVGSSRFPFCWLIFNFCDWFFLFEASDLFTELFSFSLGLVSIFVFFILSSELLEGSSSFELSPPFLFVKSCFICFFFVSPLMIGMVFPALAAFFGLACDAFSGESFSCVLFMLLPLVGVHVSTFLLAAKSAFFFFFDFLTTSFISAAG